MIKVSAQIFITVKLNFSLSLSIYIYIYMVIYLQTILRFRKNKYTDNNQLQSHVDKRWKRLLENVETTRIAQHPEEM